MQLSPEELPALVEHARKPEVGFIMCECAVNGNQHRGIEHEPFAPQTPEEFAQWLPCVIAGYSAGNNTMKLKYAAEQGGTKVVLCRAIAQDYGLDYQPVHTWEEAVAGLEEGYSIVTTVSKGVFTAASHFLCVASVTDGYIYILDPLMREKYDTDKRHVLEVVEPGLVRAKEEDLLQLGLAGFYMMKRVDN